MLEIKGLGKTYESGDKALTEINLEVKEGEVLGIIGSSGAGKSTLLRCINRLVEPSSGEILFNDRDVTKLNKKELRQVRRNMGMIFQEYALVERLTVMENVLSGRLGYQSFLSALFRRFPQDDVDTAIKLLNEVGLKDQMKKRADTLSGGQRQRVGIARALIQNPKLLLVDEATASLDPRTARQIMKLIRKLAKSKGLTVLFNMHDVELAKIFAERIIGIKDGKIVYDGSPKELDNSRLGMIYGGEDWQTSYEEDLEQENNIEKGKIPLAQSEVV